MGESTTLTEATDLIEAAEAAAEKKDSRTVTADANSAALRDRRVRWGHDVR